jgi:HlyD family secretion protein
MLRKLGIKRVAFILVILLIGFLVSKKVFSKSTSGYIMGTVQKQTITEMVTESGIVTTSGRVTIYSPTTGIVGKVFVANDDRVSEGQKLFTVKSTATPQEKTTALAAFQAAKAAVQQAENNRRLTTTTVDRVHDDLKDKDSTETFTEKETRTTAEVAHDNAYDVLLSAQAQLVSAQVAYQATQNSTVTAPISGLVSNLSVASGSAVLVNNVLAPTSPILVLGGLGPTEIVISVGENDINKIQVGQKADIKLDAVDDRVFQGVVKRFDTGGTITQGVVKFNVYLEVTDFDHRLKPGMTADVDIVTSELTDVLSVPNSAVKPYQKGRAVRRLDNNGKLEYIPIKIGLRGKEFTQIIEGLGPDQEIILSLTNEKTKKTSPLGF